VSPREELRIGELAAWRFAPRGERRTTIVMAHGFSMTMRDGLEPYAQILAEAGHEVLVFDHRYLGESGGEPRQRFRIREQLEDWRSAIAHARAADGLGAERLVLWGFSMSGGHVATLAAEAKEGELAAAIMVCPFLDGFARVRAVKLRHFPYILSRALLDLAGRHTLIPTTAPVGEHAAMNFEGEYEGFLASRKEGSRWENGISPAVFATVAFHRPLTGARKVSCPAWVGLGERDITVSGKAIERFAERAPAAELHRYDCDHFEPFYADGLAERIAGDHVRFLANL
jgi:fermentation-respiration switch protein FrsA (DUF1100 family)